MTDESGILDRLRNGIGKHAGPVDERDIADAEATLGVRFPTSYRVFLKHFGAAWLPVFYEIARLGPGRCTDPTPPLWLHVVDMNLQMRRYSRGLIPAEYVRICDNGGDYSFHLDTGNAESNGECPVVVLGPGGATAWWSPIHL